MNVYRITHRINGTDYHHVTEARDADGAQERFVDFHEVRGLPHGTIVRIRQIG